MSGLAAAALAAATAAAIVQAVLGEMRVEIAGTPVTDANAAFTVETLTINGVTSASPACIVAPVLVSRNDGVQSSFAPPGHTLVPGVQSVLTDTDLFSGENAFAPATALSVMFGADVSFPQQSIVIIEVSGGDACVVSALNAAGAVIGSAFAALPSTYGPDLMVTRNILYASGATASIGPVHGFSLNLTDFALPAGSLVRGVQLLNCPGLDVTWIGVVGCAERITLPPIPSTTSSRSSTSRSPISSTSGTTTSRTTESQSQITFGGSTTATTTALSTSMQVSSSSSNGSFPVDVGLSTTADGEMPTTGTQELPWWIFVVAAVLCICFVLCGVLIGWAVWARQPRDAEVQHDANATAVSKVNDFPEMRSMEARSVASGSEFYSSAAIFAHMEAAPPPFPAAAPTPVAPLPPVRNTYAPAPRSSIYANGNAFATQSEYGAVGDAETVYELPQSALD